MSGGIVRDIGNTEIFHSNHDLPLALQIAFFAIAKSALAFQIANALAFLWCTKVESVFSFSISFSIQHADKLFASIASLTQCEFVLVVDKVFRWSLGNIEHLTRYTYADCVEYTRDTKNYHSCWGHLVENDF